MFEIGVEGEFLEWTPVGQFCIGFIERSCVRKRGTPGAIIRGPRVFLALESAVLEVLPTPSKTSLVIDYTRVVYQASSHLFFLLAFTTLFFYIFYKFTAFVCVNSLCIFVDFIHPLFYTCFYIHFFVTCIWTSRESFVL